MATQRVTNTGISILKSALCAAGVLCTASYAAVSVMRHRVKQKTDVRIQEQRYLQLGGIDQYVQIRGVSENNPLILWVHGGPGYPLTYLARHYQYALEKQYTVATWEQRGSGRTWHRNKQLKQASLTLDVLLKDMDELVDYLCERYDRDRIILLGQSWGSVLATEYVQRHPNKVTAYIGTGQIVDFKQGKLEAVRAAIPLSDSKTAQELKIASEAFAYTTSVDDIDTKELERMILNSLKPLKGSAELSPIQQMMLGLSSPDFSAEDLKWLIAASNTNTIFQSQHDLVNYMYYRYSLTNIAFPESLPVCFIQGQHDWIAPSAMVREYYKTLPNPAKHYAEVAGAGHTPFLDDPDAFSHQVMSFLKGIHKLNL